MGESNRIGEQEEYASLASLQQLTQRVIQLEEHFKYSQIPQYDRQFNEPNRKLGMLGSTNAVQHFVNIEKTSNSSVKVMEDYSPQDRKYLPLPYFRDVLKSLSMPGMNFIGGRCQSWLHSIIWIFIHIAALLISYACIMEEYKNWQHSPVVRTVSNNLTFVHEVPFPAITVCLPSSVKEGYDYSGRLKKCFLRNDTSEDNRWYFNKMCDFQETASVAVASLYCHKGLSSDLVDEPWHVYEHYIQGYMKSGEFLNYTEHIFSTCDVSVLQKRITIIDRIVTPHYFESGGYRMGTQHFVSRYGMCFTLNSLSHDDILREDTILSLKRKTGIDIDKMYIGQNFTLDDMVYFNGNINTVPVYIRGDQGIDIAITKIKKYRGSCVQFNGKTVPEAAVLMHNPVEVPFLNHFDFTLEIGKARSIRVTPELVTTDRALRNYKSTDRGCYYSNERHLQMFKHYSEANCKTECVANCSLQSCGCVPYYLPRHNNSVHVCFSKCEKITVCDCGCLPDCYSLSYDFESNTKKDNSSEVGSLRMEFKKEGFYRTVRVSFTTLSQFTAYCLGVVGVFNGFNIMIIFEVLYYLTFKLWDSVKANIK